jgi:ectoine hydroxylase-related dioxygenase (phytanoyl-CoA dioxygenase family)
LTVDDVLAGLDVDGYAVVEGVLDGEQVAKIRAELDPLVAALPTGRNAFEGFHTRRLYSLLAKTRVLDALVLDPLVEVVTERAIGHHHLSATVAISIGPGEVAQAEHFDDAIYPLPRPHDEVIINTMWALDDFTVDNGATVMLPGSHRWIADRPDESSCRVIVAMPAGSVILYRGSVWHGGGANHTAAPRLGVLLEFVSSWLRQQENHCLAVPAAVVATLPERLQDLLGWNIRPPFVGYVDGRDPKRTLLAAHAQHADPN